MNPQYLQMLQYVFGNLGGNMWNMPNAQSTTTPNNGAVNKDVMNNSGVNSYVTFNPNLLTPQNAITQGPRPGDVSMQDMEAEMKATPGNLQNPNSNPYTSMNPFANPNYNPTTAPAYLTQAQGTTQSNGDPATLATTTNTNTNTNTNSQILSGWNLKNRKPGFSSSNNNFYYSKFM